MKRQEVRRSDRSQWTKCVCEVLKGGALAGLVSVALLLLWSVLIAEGIMGERWTEPAVLAACVIGSAAGGVWARRGNVRGRWAVGACVGCVLFLILLTAGILVYESASLDQGGGKILAACLCGGVLAAVPVKGRGKKAKLKSTRRGKV